MGHHGAAGKLYRIAVPRRTLARRPQGTISDPPTISSVMVRDRAAGTTTAVPLPPQGQESKLGVISGDGCTVAYWASSLTDAGGLQWRVYTWDRCTPGAAAELASNQQPRSSSQGGLAISVDGGLVAYSSWAEQTEPRVAVITIGDHTEIEMPGDHRGPDGAVSLNIDLSDDGAVLAVDEDLDGDIGITVWHVGTPTTDLIDLDDPAGGAVVTTSDPSLSADGRVLAFTSGPFLDPEVYVRDLVTGEQRQITAPATLGAIGSFAAQAAITPDGSQVALGALEHVTHPSFVELIPTAIAVVRSTSGFFDTTDTELVSLGTDDAAVPADAATISATGRFVGFASSAGERFGSAPGVNVDVWLRERPPSLTSPATLDFGGVTIGASAGPMGVTVVNDSDVGVPVGSVTLTAGAFAVASDGCSGVLLAPAGSCSIAITFSPASAGATAGTITVEGDGVSTVTQLLGIGQTRARSPLRRRRTTSARGRSVRPSRPPASPSPTSVARRSG